MPLRPDDLRSLLAAFLRRRDGAAAILFALTLPVLLAFTLGMIDYTRASTTQLALQTNLDAAALYIARSDATTQAEVTAMGKRMMDANAANLKHGTLASYSFTLTSDQKVVATAEATVPVTIASLLGRPEVPVDAAAEVTRSSNNIEVGLALDVTGSMREDIDDLKVAAKDLIDLVVKDEQTPYYSKVALVPYSMAVNVGSYANQVRGTPHNGSSTVPGSKQFQFHAMASKDRNRRDEPPYAREYSISNCVTERVDSEEYTDAPPSIAPVGRNYPGPGNPCLSSTIVPLSSNRSTLKNSINSYRAEGSTAGHIGLAWAWYMVSPNFGYLWPSSTNRPAAYGTRELLKVVVLMTDGAFNTPYCKGVVATNAGDGSSDESERIASCNATNGNSFSQAKTLCENMKKAGVIVYTVGLGVGSDPDANEVLTKCATNPDYVYFPSSGGSLKDAFRAIAQSINSLRISK